MGRHDLTDDEWAIIKDELPQPKTTGRPLRQMRTIVNGIGWVVRTGAPWRDVPAEYGPWSTVYRWFRTWRNDGTWDRILTLLLIHLWEEGLLGDPLWCVDGTLIRATTAAAGARKRGGRKMNPLIMPWAALVGAWAPSSTGSAREVGFLSPSFSPEGNATNPPSSLP